MALLTTFKVRCDSSPLPLFHQTVQNSKAMVNYEKTCRLPKCNGDYAPVGGNSIHNRAGYRTWWRKTGEGKDLTYFDHLRIAGMFLELVEAIDKSHLNQARKFFFARFGRTMEFGDWKISGIGCDEFTDEQKEVLRVLVKRGREAQNKAYAHLAMLKKSDRKLLTD